MKNLYRYSLSEAKRNNELDEWRESFKENVRCRDFLDNEVKEKFDGMHLPDECAKNAVKEFGYDRTMWVIANTVLEREGDGRFHRENREWANMLGITKENQNYEFSLSSHSVIVDGLASDVRKMYSALGLFSGEHIVKSDEPQDYKGKLLVIKDTVLKEEFRTPENQLFLASRGSGCSPTSSGRKVYGQFLSDGEKTHFDRSDFVGVLANEHTPKWAKEKMEQKTEETAINETYSQVIERHQSEQNQLFAETDVSSDQLEEMTQRHNKEIKEAIASDKTGDGFIKDMFKNELINQGYGYVLCYDNTLKALGIPCEDLVNDDRLLNGLKNAANEIDLERIAEEAAEEFEPEM